MAEKLCQLKKKGGGNYIEDILWSNSAPTSSFANKDITLNTNLSDYDTIRVYYRVSTSNSKTAFIDVLKSDFEEMNGTNGTLKVGLACFDDNTSFLRAVNYVNASTIHFNSAGQIGVTTTNNAKCIPVKVCGLN